MASKAKAGGSKKGRRGITKRKNKGNALGLYVKGKITFEQYQKQTGARKSS